MREYQKVRRLGNKLRLPEVDDIVIIKDQYLPRQRWRLGRVVKLLVGRDESVRAAQVLIGKTGIIINRPVNLLYPLEGDVEKIERTAKAIPDRTRRQAAIDGEIRRRYNINKVT